MDGMNQVTSIMVAHQLMRMEKDAVARRKGEHVEEKTIQDYFKEDQALIGSFSGVEQTQQAQALPPVQDMKVNLPVLKQQLNALDNGAQPTPAQDAGAGTAVTISQSISISMELRLTVNAPISGLVARDKNVAETDRYLFNFKDGQTLTILDKWANKSTTIWGDPHVDVDDVEGANNGDFKDLKTSNDHTTFMLADGARLTFKAKDDGLIERVDIFKGSQHLSGTGQADEKFTPESGLFETQVKDDGQAAAGSTPLGDVVYAGGDGNDWFSAGNKLVWGKTTGAAVNQRPAYTLEFSYQQSISQQISIQTFTKNA